MCAQCAECLLNALLIIIVMSTDVNCCQHMRSQNIERILYSNRCSLSVRFCVAFGLLLVFRIQYQRFCTNIVKHSAI